MGEDKSFPSGKVIDSKGGDPRKRSKSATGTVGEYSKAGNGSRTKFGSDGKAK